MPTAADDDRRQLPRVAVMVSVVVLAGLAVADWYTRNLELHQVVLAAEDAHDAIGHWHTARHEIAASLPSSHYLTDEHSRRGERLIRCEATASARSLTASAARIQTITVRLPWHHAIVSARNRYREHVNARIARLSSLSRVPPAWTNRRRRSPRPAQPAKRPFAPRYPQPRSTTLTSASTRCSPTDHDHDPNGHTRDQPGCPPCAS